MVWGHSFFAEPRTRHADMSQLALARLAQERKDFRRNRPFGFAAKPQAKSDGSVNLLVWDCVVPGKAGTAWEEGRYPVRLEFSEDYPTHSPKAMFPAGFLHPNVYPDGKVCLSILNDDPDLGGQWAPSLTVQQILLGIQELLGEPNLKSPAQDYACKLLQTKPRKYNEEVRRQAEKYRQEDND